MVRSESATPSATADVWSVPSMHKSASFLQSPPCLLTASFVALALFALRLWQSYAFDGLFYVFGLDYAIYGASARVVVDSGWAHLYDKEAITQEYARWLTPGPSHTRPPMWVACPYPAPFFLLLVVTNLLGHAGGFAAWTVLNLLLYATIVRGLAGSVGRRDPLMLVAPFAFLPFLYNVYLGQSAILMAFGLYRAYRAFQSDHEFAAGCWLGLLLLKPQLALIVAMVLLGKRRWTALGGLILCGIGIAASMLALVGINGIRDDLGILRAFSGFRHVPLVVYPQDMINFRGLLVNILPESWSEDQGTAAVLGLFTAMALSLIVVWRGPWDPRVDRFPRQMLATLIVAMFAGFHNHIHGATLLIVPMLATLGRRRDADPLPAFFALLIFRQPSTCSAHS